MTLARSASSKAKRRQARKSSFVPMSRSMSTPILVGAKARPCGAGAGLRHGASSYTRASTGDKGACSASRGALQGARGAAEVAEAPVAAVAPGISHGARTPDPALGGHRGGGLRPGLHALGAGDPLDQSAGHPADDDPAGRGSRAPALGRRRPALGAARSGQPRAAARGHRRGGRALLHPLGRRQWTRCARRGRGTRGTSARDACAEPAPSRCSAPATCSCGRGAPTCGRRSSCGSPR